MKESAFNLKELKNQVQILTEQRNNRMKLRIESLMKSNKISKQKSDKIQQENL